MLRVLLISQIVATVVAQVNNGFLREGLQNVVLHGEPHLVARRILRGPTHQLRQTIEGREANWAVDGGRTPVNVMYADGEVQGQQIMVYRHVLRPARLIFNDGQEKIIHQWVHNEDVSGGPTGPQQFQSSAPAPQMPQNTFARQPFEDSPPSVGPPQVLHGGEVRNDAQWIANADALERSKLMRQHWFDDLKHKQ